MTDMDTAVAALEGTVSKMAQLRAQLAALAGTVGAQVATVRLKHDGVEAALNTASNNDPAAAQAWVGKTRTHTPPTPISTSTAPPEKPAVTTLKQSHGTAVASCTPEAGAVCYLFQQGSDPAHPETWPAAVPSPRATPSSCTTSRSGRWCTSASRSCAAAGCRASGRPWCRSWCAEGRAERDHARRRSEGW